MSLLLRIESGPHAGTALPLETGKDIRVGRAARADHAIPEDSFLSGVHFEVRSDGGTCTLLDLKSSNGTTVLGERIAQATLSPGDRFIAGKTEFSIVEELVRTPAAAPQASAPKPPPGAVLEAAPRERLLKEMRTHLQPLYAVVDAAHDSKVLAVLSKYKCEYSSLFLLEKAPELVRFAPYIVALPASSTALEPLVDMGWGKDWAIYLTSTASGRDLIATLRRLLLARTQAGEEVLLRFYDPRVLRTLLNNATQGQWQHFFGVVKSYLVAGEAPQIALGFAMSDRGLERHDIPLAGDKPASRTAVLAAPAAGSTPDNRLLLSKQQMDALKS